MRWLILLFALVGHYSFSNEPPKPQGAAQKPATEQRGSEQSPIFVKAPSPATQTERDNEAYEKHQKPWNETALANATIALAIITAFLAVFTGFLWKATQKLVRDNEVAIQILDTKIIPRFRMPRTHNGAEDECLKKPNP